MGKTWFKPHIATKTISQHISFLVSNWKEKRKHLELFFIFNVKNCVWVRLIWVWILLFATRMALDLWSLYFSLPCAGIIGMHCHIKFYMALRIINARHLLCQLRCISSPVLFLLFGGYIFVVLRISQGLTHTQWSNLLLNCISR